MAVREIVVRLRAEAGDFRRTFAAAQKDAQGLDTALGRTSRSTDASVARMGGSFSRLTTSIRSNRDAWDDLGKWSMVGGAAVGVGLGLATKAAIDWESAWAGVKKTTDGTPAQMAELEQGLRGLAKTLPATHEEIAAVAEAAGQLGIARKDIIGFTETAIALGESTNLSADEAATGLAKISNVMGTLDREGVEGIERMGSALVALGNDGASTEADILRMAQRLSGAGDLIGATESDILAMSSALSSVGIEAELGGGAMSRGLIKMNSAVLEGDEKLQLFAKTAGMTADEFATAWRANPIAAANEFVAGLGRVSDSGGDAAEILNDVGLRGTENAQVFLRAAGASGMLTEQLKLGAEAYADNTALMDEANQRYATTESRLQVAQNSMKDAAIDLGSVAGPALAGFAEKLAGIANAFVQLPAPVKNTVTAVAGLTAAAGLAGGATVKIIGFAQDFGDALDKVGMKGPRAEAAINRTGKAAAFAGKAFAGAAVAGAAYAILQDDVGSIGSEQLIRRLRDTGDAVTSINEAISEADGGASDVQDIGKALQVAFDPNWIDDTGKALDGFFGLFGAEATGEVAMATRRLEELDSTMAQLVSTGDTAGAGSMFSVIADEAEKQGVKVDELKAKFPQYAEALAAAENQSDATGAATGDLGGDLDQVGAAAEDAEKKIDDLAKVIEGLGGGFRSERAAAREVRDALKEIGEAAKGSADDQQAALDDLAQSQLDHIATMARNGKDSDALAAATRRARAEFISAANDLGIYGRAASDLADKQGLIDTDVTLFYESMGLDEAKSDVAGLKQSLDLIKPPVQTKVSVPGAKDARSQTQAFYDSLVTLPPAKDTKITAPGATSAKGQTDAFNSSVKGIAPSKSTTVSAPGATGAKSQVDDVTSSVFRIPPSKSVTVTANTGAAIAALAGVSAYMAAIQSKTVTITTQQRTVGGRADGGLDEFRGGRHIQAMANGGTWDPRRPWDTTLGAMQPGIKPVTSRGILMAEEGAGPWEAFISGHPAKRDRSEAIWLETGKKLGLIEAFANGGVYGNWQAELRNVKRLKSQYRKTRRFEDGSSKVDDPIRISEDGSARWAGYYSAPAYVAHALARLNKAQDAYEKEKRRQGSGRRGEKRKETPEEARKRYLREHDAKSTPRPPGGYRYPGRGNSDRSVSSQNYLPGRSGGAGVDSAAIGRAVAQAMQGWRPLVRIGDRELYGVMQRVNDKQRGR